MSNTKTPASESPVPLEKEVYAAFGLIDPDKDSNGATSDLHEDGTPAGPPAKMDAPRPRGFDF
jgi:hypothetical protein